MCFTPQISLATAFIEIILALLLLIFYKRSRLAPYVSILMFMLAFYQLTEFLLCTTPYKTLWAHLGFMNNSFLPAFGLFATLAIAKGKKYWSLFIIPVVFIIWSFFLDGFINIAQCETYFITVRTLFQTPTNVMGLLLYTAYYGLFILLAGIFFIQAYRKEQSEKRKKVFILLFIAILLFVLPTFILIFILPSLSIQFPSILCEFALLLSIVASLAVYIEEK